MDIKTYKMAQCSTEHYDFYCNKAKRHNENTLLCVDIVVILICWWVVDRLYVGIKGINAIEKGVKGRK